MQVLNPLIGCDPEMFLQDKQGKFISAVGLIGGSKEDPFMISAMGHAVQEDNVAVEFNIPPAKTKEAWVTDIQFVMDYLTNSLKDKELVLRITASTEFEADQLACQKAQTFGCDPDFNAWTRQQNPRPMAKSKSLRSCGGHIHIGYDKPSVETNIALIKAMDLFTSIPLLEQDMDTRRRELYGKAGAFRHKAYGVEYRTLSNFWLSSKELMEFIFDQTHKAINFVNSGSIMDDDDLLVSTINDNKLEYIPYFEEKYGVTTLVTA